MAIPMKQGGDTSGSPKRRILIVEDDPDSAHLIMRALSEEFEVLVACNGVQGLSMALSPPHPELIITDLMMPELDGISMTKALRAKLPTVPVIMLTAHGKSGPAVEAIQAGVRAFVHKPMNLEQLRKRVRSALGPRYT